MPDRRTFIKQVGATALVTAGYSATAAGFAANETLNVACVGTGPRCQYLMRVLGGIAGVRIAAVCDVWDKNLAAAKALADPQANTTKDFRELLDRPDIDAIVIGAPDHWHTPMTIAACEAGKDVYVEKPVTHTIEEGPALIAAQAKSGRIVQVGTQQRSMPQFQKAREIVKSGVLGPIHKAHLQWNRNVARWNIRRGEVDPATVDWKRFLGNAPNQPFNEYRFRNWRWFWDFGGGIFTDLMVHHLDIVYWLLGLEKPSLVTAVGDQFATRELWETPDSVQGLLQYDNPQLEVHFEGTFVNARQGSMLELMGPEGTLYLDRGRYELIPERGRKLEASEMVLGSGPKGADSYEKPNGELLHLTNWIECIRSREEPIAPVSAGVAAAHAAHLANQAVRSRQIVKA